MTESSLLLKQIEQMLSLMEKTNLESVPDKYLKFTEVLALAVIAQELKKLNDIEAHELA